MIYQISSRVVEDNLAKSRSCRRSNSGMLTTTGERNMEALLLAKGLQRCARSMGRVGHFVNDMTARSAPKKILPSGKLPSRKQFMSPKSLETTRRLFSFESSTASMASLLFSGDVLWEGGLIEAARGSGDSVGHLSMTSGSKDIEPGRV